jgi:pyruvate dehydrogenase E1 component alpha subunit/2-oxoisovalerate dehydrogenase E1 component alpha subunit
MLSHLGAMISVVNGVLFARRLKGHTGSVGAASIGDGATSTGAFHESLNQAAVEKLPLVLVVANNQFAYSTPTSRQFVCNNLVDKAIGYGVEGHTVDGTDLLACLKTMNLAVQNARNGRGPQLVIGELLRLCGHGEHDDAHYVSTSIKQSSLGQDCLRKAEQSLLERQWADQSTLSLWLGEAQNEVDACVQMVQREPAPNADLEQWLALSDPRSCPDPNTLE